MCQASSPRTLNYHPLVTSRLPLAHRLLLSTAHTVLVFLRAWHSMLLHTMPSKVLVVTQTIVIPSPRTARTLRCTSKVINWVLISETIRMLREFSGSDHPNRLETDRSPSLHLRRSPSTRKVGRTMEKAWAGSASYTNGWGMHLHPVAAVSFYSHGVHGRNETTFSSISQAFGRRRECQSGQSDGFTCSAVISSPASLSTFLFLYLWASVLKMLVLFSSTEPRFHASTWRSDRNN